MENNYNVDLEKLDKLLAAKARNCFAISNSKISDEHVRSRFRAAGVELTIVRDLLRDQETFNAVWDIYMN